MARDVKEQWQILNGVIRLVQDIRDDPERTDRWFVEIVREYPFNRTEAQVFVRFSHEQDARDFILNTLEEGELTFNVSLP